MYGRFFNGKHVREEEERDKREEEGVGARKGTQIEDSWAQMMGGGIDCGSWELGRGEQGGEGGTTETEQ